MRNCINIKLTKDEIVMKIQEDSEEGQIIANLEKKLLELKGLYKEAKTPILVTGKILSNKEMESVRKIIEKTIPVEVRFDSPKDLGLHSIKRVFNKEIDISTSKFYKGSLRSGQKLEFEGSLIILGDVNAGSEVMGSNNIVVLGILRGLAHAGAKGNKRAIIAAEKIESPQLRIANVVKEIEKMEEGKFKKYAYIQEEQMILE